jgi:hypothetical protein
MLAYARFYKAGPMKVFAAVVDLGKTDNEVKSNERFITKRNQYGFYEWWIQHRGELNVTAENSDWVYASTSADVIIPEGVFGKEPSGWVKWYVNLWHGRTQAEDQCEFRRRAILAFTLKWIPVSLWAMLYTFASVVALLAIAGIGLTSWIANWKVAFQPFDGSWSYMIDPDEGEYGDFRDSRFVPWITWNKEQGIKQPIWFVIILSPTIIALFIFAAITAFGIHVDFWWYEAHKLVAVLAIVLGSIVAALDVGTAVVYAAERISPKLSEGWQPDEHGKRHVTGTALVVVVLVLTMLTVGPPLWITIMFWSSIALIVGWVVFIRGGSDNKYNLIAKIIDAFDRAFVHTATWLWGNDSNDYTEIRELLCPKDHQNLSTDIKSIPKERRTWRLQFHALKQKVCKPMQR